MSGVSYSASLNLDQLTASLTAKFSWGTSYASMIHEGVKLKNGTVVPPRPWTKAALRQMDVAKVFSEFYKQSHDADDALKQTALLLSAKFTEMISSPIWTYPRATKRKSGETALSPRSIVDLGGLRGSQQLVFVR